MSPSIPVVWADAERLPLSGVGTGPLETVSNETALDAGGLREMDGARGCEDRHVKYPVKPSSIAGNPCVAPDSTGRTGTSGSLLVGGTIGLGLRKVNAWLKLSIESTEGRCRLSSADSTDPTWSVSTSLTTEALLAEGVNAIGLGLLKVNDSSKLSMDATDGGSGVYSTDWTGTSGSMSPLLTTEASSVQGVNATTDVDVEDLDDDPKAS